VLLLRKLALWIRRLLQLILLLWYHSKHGGWRGLPHLLACGLLQHRRDRELLLLLQKLILLLTLLRVLWGRELLMLIHDKALTTDNPRLLGHRWRGLQKRWKPRRRGWRDHRSATPTPSVTVI